MAVRGGFAGGESVTAVRGGFAGGESIMAVRGGFAGGESVTAVRGGFAGGESITVVRGGFAGGESIKAKAELATAQPATKATRLTFIMIAPSGLLTGASRQTACSGRLAMIKATPGTESPHRVSRMYA